MEDDVEQRLDVGMLRRSWVSIVLAFRIDFGLRLECALSFWSSILGNVYEPYVFGE